MTMHEQCERFMDDLASIVDGDEGALDRHLDHLSGCDSCRDARHEASAAARALGAAGDDFRLPADLTSRVLAGLAGAKPAATETAAAEPARARGPESPKTSERDRRPQIASRPAGRRRWLAAGAACAAAAAAVAAAVALSPEDPESEHATTATGAGPISATLVATGRAANDGEIGVMFRAPGSDSFVKATPHMTIPAGAAVKTDERTRARLSLADGSEIALNHLTELSFAADQVRTLRLSSGELVADVAHIDGAPRARFELPTGSVEVLGTQFLLTAAAESSTVRVTRGLVKLAAADGSVVEVRPGEEGVAETGKPAAVSPTLNLASALGWSEVLTDGTRDASEDDGAAGIGELRAFKPGEKRDRDWPLTLAKHNVTVRISGNVARTEIEETFRNDSDATLEGVYRFPLPSDAGIDRLALDVGGKFEEGAFVEKDRATKIWRGVIRNATPNSKPLIQEELIWVPGPWRDPALLEWQRGGRFELRIFPIPKRGSRTVKIAYIQTIAPEGRSRRYVYPLAHSKDGSTAAETFDLDVRLSGIDDAAGVRPVGYDLAESRDGGATRLSATVNRFVPRGNLVIEYRLPDPDTELRAWTFQGNAAVAPSARANKGPGADAEVIAAQHAVAADNRSFVVMALKPQLPRWSEAKRRDYVLIVDSSQSMFGERTARASKLVEAMIAEMDRGDRFALLACDIDCRQMSAQLSSPSSAAARDAAAWLSAVEPAGASNLAGALRRGGAIATSDAADRSAWVIYVGDGLASIGHRRPAAISAEVAQMAERGVSFSTVGIGGDADATALGAIARAGGGHFIPYVPGQRAAASALAVLETTYGVSLRDASVKLPAGLTDVAPSKLPTLRAGGEMLIAARFEGPVEGDVVLSGTVGGKPFENRFPIRIAPSTAKGNAFVPRMWAALEIGELELAGRSEDRDRIVALSKGFGVMSRHTSLLVLESEAMFRAFGVDRAQPAAQWTGEEEAEQVVADGATDFGYGHGVGTGDGFGVGALALGRKGGGGGGGGAGFNKAGKPNKKAKAEIAFDHDGPFEEESPRKDAPDERPAEKRPASAPAPAPTDTPAVTTIPLAPPSGRGGRWMRRVWFTTASVAEFDGVHPNIIQAVADAEGRLRQQPDSRERHRALVQSLSYAGELERALDVARAWHERDRMDPQALVAIADVLGRQGKRADALRVLSGVVDIQPDDEALQERLAAAYARIQDKEHECDHRIAVAEIDADDAGDVASAIRCLSGLGRADAAQRVTLDADASVRNAALTAAALPAPAEAIRGQLVLGASWLGASDLDISLITPQGTRVSWMGGRSDVAAEAAGELGRERLALRRAPRGNYLIEVSRADPADTRPIQGTVEVNVHGTRRMLSFDLSGPRASVGRIAIARKSRLVEM